VTIQAVEWRMSPFAVANKSYSVNDRLAYESQLVQAVVLQRAPIVGRIAFEFEGEGPTRTCTARAALRDGTNVEYKTLMVKDIPTKNSPLWKSDVDQQLTYVAGRNLARRYFPDVLLGVYSEDELRDTPQRPEPLRINPLQDDVEGEAFEVSASSAPQAESSGDGEGSVAGAADPKPTVKAHTVQGEASIDPVPDGTVYVTPPAEGTPRGVAAKVARGHRRPAIRG
jgi:hypothetical protein